MLGKRKKITRLPKDAWKEKYKTKFLPKDARDLGYLCGLIATDGCLYSKEKRITISLKKGDERPLQWLSNLLTDGEIPVFTREVPSRTFKGEPITTETSFFAITLHELYDYLVEFGITPSKSLNLNVNLENKSEVFKLFFLRGVIDGDGSVGLPNKKSAQGYLHVYSSSLAFVTTFKQNFGGRIALDARNQKKNPKAHLMYRWIAEGSLCKELVKKLPNRSFMLERKNKRIKQLRYRYRSDLYFIDDDGNKLTLIEGYHKYKPDCHLTTIYHCIKHLGLGVKEALLSPRRGTRPPRIDKIET